MSLKKKLAITVLSGVTVLGLGYKCLDGYIDYKLSSAIRTENYRPQNWIALFPGKADKTVDLYLGNLDDMYEREPKTTREDIFTGIIVFTKNHVPDRIPEVYRTIVDLLLEKEEQDALFYAKELAHECGDTTLYEEVKNNTRKQ